MDILNPILSINSFVHFKSIFVNFCVQITTNFESIIFRYQASSDLLREITSNITATRSYIDFALIIGNYVTSLEP